MDKEERQVKGNIHNFGRVILLQIRYSLVMILELNSVSEVQYKDMMIDR